MFTGICCFSKKRHFLRVERNFFCNDLAMPKICCTSTLGSELRKQASRTFRLCSGRSLIVLLTIAAFVSAMVGRIPEGRREV